MVSGIRERGLRNSAAAPLLTRLQQEKARGVVRRAPEPAIERSAPPVSVARNHTSRSSIDGSGLGLASRAVLLGIGGVSMLTGCATAGFTQPSAARNLTGAAIGATPPFGAIATAEAKYDAFKARSAELARLKGSMPYSDLAKLRAELYDAYKAGGGTLGMRVDAAKGLTEAQEILYGVLGTHSPDSAGDGIADAFKIANGLDPTDRMTRGEASTKAWTYGYIPMVHNPLIEDGALIQYDMLIRDRTGKDPAVRHIEGGSGMADGHYFLSGTLDENDAELTTGIDWNGDGVLTPGVKADFLTPSAGEASFGKDGKFTEKLDVGWWGHCNDVATAGINFREPKASVTIKLNKPFDRYTVETSRGTFQAEAVTKGATTTDIKLIAGQTVRLPNSEITSVNKQTFKEVTFTPDQLKEITAELVHRGSKYGTDFVGHRFNGRDATITLANGTQLHGGLVSSLDDRADTTDGAYTTATNFTKDVTVRVFDFNTQTFVEKTFKPSELKSIVAENARDPSPIEFHLTMLKWLSADKKAGVMDKDPGPHVWNYAFDRYEISQDQVRANDKNTHDYEMKVWFAQNDYPTTYSYSITYKNGVPQKSKWAENSSNPDFFWRDKGGAEGYDHDNGSGLDFKSVMGLLQASYAAEDAAAHR
jgi:hypothetical protein